LADNDVAYDDTLSDFLQHSKELKQNRHVFETNFKHEYSSSGKKIYFVTRGTTFQEFEKLVSWFVGWLIS
jgi:hypothetical protein